jgi:hypothetical protein
MARSPGMSQALARSPGLVVSTVLTCLVGALLPPLPGLTLFVGGLALMVVLCAGGLEQPAVRVLGHARVFSEEEAVALAPAIALLCQKGIGPPVVELYARDGEVEISAGAAGRHSVVVSSGLLQAVQLGQLLADQAAGVIAAAVGRIRLGQTRFDVAVEFWTIPWQLVRATCVAITQAVGLFSPTRFAWGIRFVVGTVAVDRFVAYHGLGDALGRFLRRCPPEPRTLERIHRLTGPPVTPSLAMMKSCPTPKKSGLSC